MPDPDISTVEARRLLSFHQPTASELGERPGPLGWSRRTFLQAIGAGVFGGAAIGAIADDFFGGDVPEAWAGTPIGANDGILVVITMYGGNDSLNTLVPYSDPRYTELRPNIAIAANRVLKINDQVGFHPELTYLKSLYDAGQVAAVQGLGYGSPDLSHFTSMAIWMAGKFAGGPATSGWLGRWLDAQPAGVAALAAASIDTSVPLHMVGANRRAVAISDSGDMFGTGSEAQEKRMYDGIRAMAGTGAGRGQWHDLYASTMRQQLDLAADVAPVFVNELPDGELTRKLTVAARLINANIGLRVLDVSFGGFDNHENEPGDHSDLMTDLNRGLQSFFSTLSSGFRNRVTLMTVSEFGRTPDSNDSNGTDHGTTAAHFVIGANVNGGLKGYAPSLAEQDLDDNGRLRSSVDFRSMYGSVMDGWMGGGGSTIVQGGFEDLRLFRAGPGATGSIAETPIVVIPSRSRPAGYVPMTPQRVFDTRDGSGGRLGPLGTGESWTFSFAGQFDVPTDAVAAAINLTSVEATAPTFITVWPAGENKPFTANLNPVPGLAVPNLVVARLGSAASISLFNLAGTVHLVADLVGYFRTDSSLGMTPLTPSRMLDTRDGTGGSLGPIGPAGVIDLQVAGVGEVSANCKAVALNVTVTQPTDGSFLTVWPSGKPMPLAASVNMVAGQTVPNLVFATVGEDGRVKIFNKAGTTHVVADVLGCFSDDAPGKFVALTPSRALDTRDGTGAPVAPVGQSPLRVKLAGRNGVPTDGVSAVLMNVTAVRPTAETFITVFPSGQQRPLAANLNASAGQIVPNMVIGRLGPDGSVAIYNHGGGVDLVADVMGYFTT